MTRGVRTANNLFPVEHAPPPMPAPATPIPTPADEFFVAYLPPPPGAARFARAVAAVVLAAFAGAGALLAGFQRDPGRGSWDDAAIVPLEGVVVLMPYPMLIDSRGEGVLVVESGKFGSGERLAPFDGRAVTLRGTILRRDGWRMLELDPAAGSILERDGRADAAPRAGAIEWGEEIVLRAEVVDPKCFLGAMRPGEGKTHKACAALCLFGGIPPMLVWRDAASGAMRGALVTDAGGGAANERLRPVAGEMIGVRGRLGSIGGWDVIRLSAAGGAG